MRHATPRILTPWASSRRDLRIYPLPNQSAVCALSESGEILSLSLLFQFSPIPVPPPASVLRCCVGCDPPPGGGRDCAAVRSPRSPLPCVPSDTGVTPHQLTTSVPSPYHHRTSTSTMPSPHHHRAITVPSPCHHRTVIVPPPCRGRTAVGPLLTNWVPLDLRYYPVSPQFTLPPQNIARAQSAPSLGCTPSP